MNHEAPNQFGGIATYRKLGYPNGAELPHVHQSQRRRCGLPIVGALTVQLRRNAWGR